MTTKDKAKELVYKILSEISGIKLEQAHLVHPSDSYFKSAKQCALICVDEIIRTLQPDNNFVMQFWQEVREEITKL